VLHAAPGSPAELLHELGVVMYMGAAAILVVVLALALIAALGPARKTSVRLFILGGGVAFPVFTLTLLFSYALAVGGALSDVNATGPLRLLLDCLSSSPPRQAPPQRSDEMRIRIIARQWWWEVRYERPGVEPIVLANELRIPTGRFVAVELTSADVIHSFWAPTLAGKVDMIPGRRTDVMLRSDEPGAHRGQCAEYCGGQHALMAFYVIADRPEEYRAWLAREATPAAEPASAFLELGREMFFRGDCHECHTIRGTRARGVDGPDLTHVGSRRSLAAGALRNHTGTMAGWIAGAQDVKPGSLMPSSREYTGHELRALSAWLESLE
jgi:cytochrome c oxidase subunit 2